MKIMISDKTLKETKDCLKNFICLEGNKENICKVRDCLNKRLYFIECLQYEPCTYQKHFGGNTYCACPTRKEIYDKHGI